ncbi:hypothetical protein HY30_08215 [Hyphomonas chukchiensis]|uniref:Uncharacterized protein n=1 Tax=Hyphomonas chukchiensis TaxID=1280947 RepID=A0A062UA16_9PROT|nr:hypothetical protein HY30_08215 [Hyphomonas chukchiensis]
MQLKDKVAIIAGAISGIGKAAALLFAREGAKMVLGAHRGSFWAGLLMKFTRPAARPPHLSGT